MANCIPLLYESVGPSSIIRYPTQNASGEYSYSFTVSTPYPGFGGPASGMGVASSLGIFFYHIKGWEADCASGGTSSVGNPKMNVAFIADPGAFSTLGISALNINYYVGNTNNNLSAATVLTSGSTLFRVNFRAGDIPVPGSDATVELVCGGSPTNAEESVRFFMNITGYGTAANQIYSANLYFILVADVC